MNMDREAATSRPELTTLGTHSALVMGLGDADPDAGTHTRPGDVVGPFRLERLLGQGGMGTVWLADQVDGRVRRMVALKLLKPGHTHPGWKIRFERERDILAGLDHPGIARLLEAGSTADGQPFLAMQYVAGEPLVRYAHRHRLGVAQRVRLVIELLAAVQHAHALLVVHRDLKPGNILVDEAGRVVLLDFGIAKIVAASEAGGPEQQALTELAGSALTLDYASPEQVAGKAVGIGTDIYSLGVVLYELLCGQRPYRLKRSTRAALEEAVLEQDIAPPSGRLRAEDAATLGVPLRVLTRQLRGDLDAIVLKALRRNVDERYPTAQAFAADLEHWLRQEPVSAQPDSRGYRLRRLVARHWQPLLAASVAACGLLAATGIALWQAHEARLATAQAQADAKQAEAVTTFMMGVFGANADASGNLQSARLRTAEQLLEVAAQRLDQDLAKVPAQRIDVLSQIGGVLFQMRLTDRALQLMGQAAQLAQQHYGPNSPKTLFHQARWVTAAANDDKTEQVADVIQQLAGQVEAFEASGQVELQRTALIIRHVQLRKEFALSSDRLLPLAERTEALWKRLPDWQDMEPTPSVILGVVYLEALRLDKAGEMFELSRQKAQRQPAYLPNNPSWPGWYGRLAERQGDYAGAERWMRMCLRLERVKDAGTALVDDFCLLRLGAFLVETGRPKEALALALSGGPDAGPAARDALQQQARTMWLHSMALTRMGRLQEADRFNRLLDAKNKYVPLYRVHTDLEAGRLEAVTRQLDDIDPLLKDGAHGGFARLAAEYRARALLGMGRLAEARQSLAKSRAMLLPLGIGVLEEVRWAWMEAGLALAEGRAAEAAELSRRWLQRLKADDLKPYATEWVARLAARLGEAELVLAGSGGPSSVHLKAAREALVTARGAYLEIVDPARSLPLAAVLDALAQAEKMAGSHQLQQRLLAQATAIRAKAP